MYFTDRYINIFINAVKLTLQFFNAVQCDSTYSYIIELQTFHKFFGKSNKPTINISTN